VSPAVAAPTRVGVEPQRTGILLSSAGALLRGACIVSSKECREQVEVVNKAYGLLVVKLSGYARPESLN